MRSDGLLDRGAGGRDQRVAAAQPGAGFSSLLFLVPALLGEVWAEVAKLGNLMEMIHKRHEETGVKQRNCVKPWQNWVVSHVVTGRGGRHGAYQAAVTPFSWASQWLEASSLPEEIKQTSAELGDTQGLSG